MYPPSTVEGVHSVVTGFIYKRRERTLGEEDQDSIHQEGRVFEACMEAESRMDFRADHQHGTSSILLKGKERGRNWFFPLVNVGCFLIYVPYKELITYDYLNQMFLEVNELQI